MTSPLPTPDDSTGKLRVDIWSDIACPWCYIGKRRFETALRTFPQSDQIEVVWHSFELDPAAPQSVNLSMQQVLARKYGRSEAEAQAMMDHVTRTAAADGLDYHLDQAQMTNTFQAHQLLHLAARHGLQDALKERLLKAYFTQGEQVGNVATLVRLAGEVGLNEVEVRAALDSAEFAAAVRQDQAQARALGITGVPFFVLGGKYGVSGAQPSAVLAQALGQAWAEMHPEPLAMLGQPDAEGCTDDSCAVPASATPAD